VTIRLDPKLNYLCELAARSQRRTKSSFIEAVIEEKLNFVPLDKRPDSDPAATVGRYAESLWHIHEHERLIALAFLAPNLMTFEEQEIWATICSYAYVWRGKWRREGDEEVWTWSCQEEALNHDRVGEYWSEIRAVSAGEKDKGELPNYDLRRKVKNDLDDEIPF
jgi:hypothetical protein